PDTTVIILDRSASMESQDLQTGESKRSTAIRKVADVLKSVGRNTKLVLVESTQNKAIEVEKAEALSELPETGASATASDLPTMMQTALDYINANETGRTDVWVCSDLRENDWDAEGGRWEGLRSGFSEKDAVRFYLLTYPQAAMGNVSVSVSNVYRRQLGNDAELVMDLKLRRDSENNEPVNIPVQFVINGARSEKTFTMTDKEYERLGMTIKIDSQVLAGHGRVELANDTNPLDNTYHFVFAEPPVHKTVIVSDDDESASLLKLAAASPAIMTLDYNAEVLSSQRADEIPWGETALLLWQAPLPDGLIGKQLENFVQSGRTVIFFPPPTADDKSLFGATWGNWEESDGETPVSITNWNTQADLFSNTQSGETLPVSDLKTYKYCSLDGELSRLAQLDGGKPLLARAPTNSGSAYFFSTLPKGEYSTLSSNHILFYVMVQRALASGAGALGTARQMDAGAMGMEDLSRWKAADESTDVIISQRAFQPGAWQSPDDRLLAINRPITEDTAGVMSEGKIKEIFGTLDYTTISDDVSDSSSLVNEIWRAFLIIMIIALVVEALLCLPERRVVSEAEAA
ncbi:MAG: VWA domain-containing protein, partial [Planctomycetaceae bacterium]